MRSTTILFLTLALLYSTGAASDTPIRALNYNVWLGFHKGEKIPEFQRWIADKRPDIVTFQELNGISEKELREIATSWGHEYVSVLKPWGFPVGITSSAEIEVIAKPFWFYHHGHIQAKTHGVNVFAVHFWPKEEKEPNDIIELAKGLVEKGEKVLIAGDFNTHSARDKSYLDTMPKLGYVYFDVVEQFERNGFVDLVHKHRPDHKRSFPTLVFTDGAPDARSKSAKKSERIDFVFANTVWAEHSRKAEVVVDETTDFLSDHYPLIVEIE
ncbi:endonuclease/exonuclease/phosphatase family protein [Microbulbifer pacificus]|uniref:Endonuclease/exonuclease/phosphatase family protein n=1 Tax=Microbulbifer pacificus TaxID=407164 RepID=A0AAU0N5D0_9GAMM|nr:endonuclease/exonuclease/phosphatase family protein [Microbulbifer pacificus]WOX07246.1 endonuclease/exonuclease/phosphatase family protein [Microbulbifer pacificus]